MRTQPWKAKRQHDEHGRRKRARMSAGKRSSLHTTGEIPDTELARFFHLSITDTAPDQLEGAGEEQHGKKELKIKLQIRSEPLLLPG